MTSQRSDPTPAQGVIGLIVIGTILYLGYSAMFSSDRSRVRTCINTMLEASRVASHGMRKTVGINLAEHEASPYEIMATLGHSSPKVTEICTRAANRRKLASGAASKSTPSAVKNK